MTPEERSRKAGFEQGYLLAVATIMHTHDDDVIACDVLRESGISANAIRRHKLCDYDAKPLRALFRAILRRNEQ